MAALAIRRELGDSMVRVRRLVVIIGMAPCTSIRRIVIISVVAGGAVIGNDCVCSVQHVIIIMDRKISRHPVRVCRMTGSAIRGEAQRLMVRVHTLAVILCMTAVTGIRRIVVVPVVTGGAIIGNSHMSTGKRINGIVVEGGRRPGRFRVAAFAIYRELASLVVRVRRLVVIIGVASCAGIRRIVVIAVVAACTVIRNDSVRPVQCVIITMDVKRSGVPARPGGVAGRTIRR